jgi:gliding motility-associated-like protein
MRKALLLVAGFSFLIPSLSNAQLVVTSGGGGTAIQSALLGPGLTLSGPININCNAAAYGSFNNGSTTNLGVNTGLVMTTGNASGAIGPNSTGANSFCHGTIFSDPELLALDPFANQDVCIITLTIIPQCSQLTIRFVFGSEEYPEWVSAGFNDAFGFFVTGPDPGGGNYTNFNVARLPNNTIVSIDNVNATTNNAFYVNNTGGTTIQYDGFTTVLQPTINVIPCQPYTFKLAIADAGDCSYDSGVFIDFLSCTNNPTVSTTPVSATCGNNDGTATANVTGGVGPFSYSWNTTPVQTTQTATGLAPGTYAVTVTDNGIPCNTPTTQTVTVGSTGVLPSTAVSPTSQSICPGGNVALTASGATSYTWSPATGLSATTGANVTATPASTTTYTVTGTNACGSVTATTTITVHPVPDASATPSPASICSGTSPAVALSSTTGSSFNWTVSQSGTSGASNGSGTSINQTLTATGGVPGTATYMVTPTANGCNGTPITVTVTVNPIPTATASNNSPVCVGNSVTLDGPTIAGATYSWTGPNGFTSNLEDPVIGSVGASEVGTYTLVVTVNGCASAPATTSVSLTPGVNPVVNPAGPFCENAAAVTLSADIPGGTWSGNGITNANTGTFDPATAGVGQHVITYTTTGGCGGIGTTTIQVTPSVGTAPSGTEFNTASNGSGGTLPGGSNDLNWEVATTLAGPFAPAIVMSTIPGSYFSSPWTDAGWIAHNTNGSHAGNVDYYYRIVFDLPCYDVCGFSYADSGVYCLTMDFFADNSVNEIYINGIAQSPNQPLLPVANQYGNIGFNAAGGLTVTMCEDWQPGTNELIIKVSSGAPFAGFLAQYSTSSINQPNDPTISAPGNDTVFCANESSVTLTAASAGGTWTSTCASCLDTNGNFTPSAAGPGTYTVTYTTNQLCPATDDITIIVHPFTAATISGSGPFCQNDPAVTLTSVNSGGTWSGTGITNASTGTFNPATAGPGTHTITYSFGGNCPSSESITITVNPTPTANAGPDQILPCVPPVVVLNGAGSSAGTYAWSTTNGTIVSGGTTTTPTAGSAGTYTLTVTSAAGCTATDVATVNNATGPNASFTVTPSSGIPPLTVATTNTSTGNSISNFWTSGDGDTSLAASPGFTYDNSGNYTLTLVVTDINGCTDTARTTIIVQEEFELLIPNVFSPNGDGSNDVFTILTKGVSDLHGRIYDRWGVFMSEFNGITGYWDGKKNGKDASEATYFFLLTVTKMTGEVVEYSGHVTLVR